MANVPDSCSGNLCNALKGLSKVWLHQLGIFRLSLGKATNPNKTHILSDAPSENNPRPESFALGANGKQHDTF
eukprot:3745171-Amphidinium_carterae.1